MMNPDADPLKDIREKHTAIMKLMLKRRDYVGVEQGGARRPLVDYGEISLFNMNDFQWLAWESHHVINLAMDALKQHEDWEEYEKMLKEQEEKDKGDPRYV